MTIPRWVNIGFMTFAMAWVIGAIIIVAVNVLGVP
jgi:hypothetical protein